MALSFEYVAFEAIDIDRVSIAVASVVPQLPDPDEVEFVWSGDYAMSITDRTPGLPPYSADRVAGRALAMTLPRAAAHCIVVADAWPYLKKEILEAAGASPDEVAATATFASRVLRHEGWHVAMHQRQEWTGNIRSRLGLGDGSRGLFAASAGVAAEEYRVERTLWDAGDGWDGSYADELDDMLTLVQNALFEAAIPWRSSSPQAVWNALTQEFHQLVTRLGYVAGEWLAVPQAADHEVTKTPVWKALLPGATWSDLTSAFQDIPSAAVVRRLADLDATTLRLGEILRAWIARLGFTIVDTPGRLDIRFEQQGAVV